MTSQELTTPFEEHDLVWAKIQNYPWWPGKIVQIFQQKNSLIFKISFYADPTQQILFQFSCYIKEDALIYFEDFRQQMNANFVVDGQLQKAIILANNAFSRKKLVSQNKRLQSTLKQSKLSRPEEPDSQIALENPSKAEEFEQSTIHIDLEVEHSNGKNKKGKKATQIKNLLLKYKLDKIPIFSKEQKIQAQEKSEDDPPALESVTEQEQRVKLFDLKNYQKRKYIKKNNKQKMIIKKRPASLLSFEERKIQLMKRLCSVLISKSIDSQISRQITVKIMEKTEQAIEKLSDCQVKKATLEAVSIKLIAILNDIQPFSSYDDKLLHIFSYIEGLLYQMGHSQKEEQEKTNIIQTQEDELSVI